MEEQIIKKMINDFSGRVLDIKTVHFKLSTMLLSYLSNVTEEKFVL